MTAVRVRQLTRADGPLIVDTFSRLSDESRRRRFLTGRTALTVAEIRHLTDIDHYDHEALAAINVADGRCVGVVRYVRDKTDPCTADVAVTVVDEWHRRGVARELLSRLTDLAVGNGIIRFQATVAADNVPVVALVHRLWSEVIFLREEFGTLEFEVGLVPGAARGVMTA